MPLGARPATCLLFASLLAACGPGACTAAPRVEICRFFEGAGRCEPPPSIAVGLRYTALIEGPSLPEGEVELRLVRVEEGGATQTLSDVKRRKSEDDRITQALIFPALGRYRLDVRTSDGRELASRTFEVTVSTVR
jgi:hypothetical protein